MLSLCRTAYRPLSRPLTRSFAEVVAEPSTQLIPVSNPRSDRPRRQRVHREKTPAPTSSSPKSNKVPVKEDHGLYAFFRRKAGDNLVGEAKYETFETPEDARIVTGRAWEAVELRNKSFKDLHTLWYVGLREKNLLATQKEETRRMGVTHASMQVSEERVRQCRKTMARIKLVLNERRLAYQGALKLAQQEAEVVESNADKEVLEFQKKLQREAASNVPPLSKTEETASP